MKRISFTTIAISIIVILGIIATIQKAYGAALAPESLPSKVADDQQNSVNIDNNINQPPQSLEEAAKKIFPKTKQKTIEVTRPHLNIVNFLWLITGVFLLIIILALPIGWMVKSSMRVWGICMNNKKTKLK